MNEDDIYKERLEEYLDACKSQLDNVLSSPIRSGDYSLPSVEDTDEAVFLEDEIESTKDLLDLFDGEDDVMKRFYGI